MSVGPTDEKVGVARPAWKFGGLVVFLSIATSLPAAGATTSWCTWLNQVIPCEIVDGKAIVEGDIMIGTAEAALGIPATPKAPQRVRSIVRQGELARWPGGRIPFEIDPEIPRPERLSAAIAHWNEHTPVKLTPRNGEDDFVYFRRFNNSGVCTSAIGRSGGQQSIMVDDGCSIRTIIHEIGHTVGFYHEQARYDRDQFVEVLFENIDPGRRGQFEFPFGGELTGDYDFASVMHYSAFAFSQGGYSMETIPRGIPIGEGQGLSAGDIDAVERLTNGAPNGYRVSTNPEGLAFLVDGVTYRSARIFDWAQGSAHTLEVPLGQPGARETERWGFGRWSDDGEHIHQVIAGAERTFYTANYRRLRRVVARARDSAAGRVVVEPPSEDGFYPDGTSITIRAEANPGYRFLGWLLGGRQTHGLGLNPVHVEARTLLDYTATFTQAATTTLASDPPGFSIRVDDRNYVAPHNFVWAPGEVHAVEPQEPSDAAPGREGGPIRHRLVGWAGGGPLSRQITAGVDGATFTAVYQAQAKLTLFGGRDDSSAVTVTPSSPDGYWDIGQQVLLSASAPLPFSHWTGDFAGTQNPLPFLVSGPASLTANFLNPFTVSRNGVLNGASLRVEPLTPGGIVTLFGVDLGPEAEFNAEIDPDTGRLRTELGGLRVLIGATPAPLLYVSRRQINAIAPFGIEGERGVPVQVERNGQASAAATVPVAATGPGVFTLNGSGRGPAAALNQDFSPNSGLNPAPRGSVVMLWVAGLGQTDPPGIDGSVSRGQLPRPLADLVARVGGRPAAVEHVSAAPGFAAGVYQVNLRIPPDAPAGDAVSLEIRANGVRSQTTATLAIQ